MGKKLSEAGVARYGRDGFLYPLDAVMTGWKRRRTCLLALLVCLAVTGCADRGRSAQEDRPGGFYGGVSGGMTSP